MCAREAPRAADYDAAHCVEGECGQLSFTWQNARISDVAKVGEHFRIQFESNGLRLTLREDGFSPGDLPDVHAYSNGFSATATTVESIGLPVDSPGDAFPSECRVSDLTAQEKLAEFLLFELSSCL
jgi:hypothetical protein